MSQLLTTGVIQGSLLNQIPDGSLTNKSGTKYVMSKDSEKYITIKIKGDE